MLMVVACMLFFAAACKKKDTEPDNPWPEGKAPMNTFLDWSLSSTPLSFVESGIVGDLAYGMNRAKLCWYNIDPIFSKSHPEKPPNITVEELSKPYVREVFVSEIFRLMENPDGSPETLTTLNFDYYPSLRGPYNYNAFPTLFAAGMDEYGNLSDPQSRWGGIMREVPDIDFNVNYIEFWMLDPFIENSGLSGDLYINLGAFNEDILRDEIPANEGSLSTDTLKMASSEWGMFGTYNKWNGSFNSAEQQDLGIDGMDNIDESEHFHDFLQEVYDLYGEPVLVKVLSDPSADDFHHYRGTDYDNWTPTAQIKVRYQRVNGYQGNSKPEHLNPENYPVAITNKPDTEDINDSKFLNLNESYREYHISVRQNDFVAGSNYISEIRNATGVPHADGSMGSYKWYHFRIPIEDFDATFGNPLSPSDLDMIRIYMTAFEEPVTLRLAYFYLSAE